MPHFTIEYSAIPNASFCTRAEASAAATLYSRADTDRIEGRSSETGEQALIRCSRALAEGAPVPKVAPAGCGA